MFPVLQQSCPATLQSQTEGLWLPDWNTIEELIKKKTKKPGDEVHINDKAYGCGAINQCQTLKGWNCEQKVAIKIIWWKLYFFK